MSKIAEDIKVVSFDFMGVFPMGKRKSNYEDSLRRHINKLTDYRIGKNEVNELFASFVASAKKVGFQTCLAVDKKNKKGSKVFQYPESLTRRCPY